MKIFRITFFVAISIFLAFSVSFSVPMSPVVTVLEQELGTGTCDEWRFIDEETVFLSGRTGRAVMRISDGEIIYGSLSDAKQLRLLDYSAEEGLVLVLTGETVVSVIRVSDDMVLMVHHQMQWNTVA